MASICGFLQHREAPQAGRHDGEPSSAPETAPMPAHERLGLEDDRGSKKRREQPVEPDEDQPICIAQPEPGWRGPLPHEQLLAEECPLGFAGRL